jgi:hypothetical protein
VRGVLPGMAFKQLRHRVQQEREEQAIRLGEIQPSLKGASGSLPLSERVPGARDIGLCGLPQPHEGMQAERAQLRIMGGPTSRYVTAAPGWARLRPDPSTDSTGRTLSVTGLSASSLGSSPARGGTPASIAPATA